MILQQSKDNGTDQEAIGTQSGGSGDTIAEL